METLNARVEFERFRKILEKAAARARSCKGGRPAIDVVLKFRMLVLRSRHELSLDATEKMARDRPSWMRLERALLDEAAEGRTAPFSA
ncbi:transposase [Palleronia aestuarii]|uniref:transposase n=1 Tax=Palleronia aestuarii TaxID=568105 RepID=UPI00147503F9|nr:transposase [Palleronia aestuarii]